MNNVIPIKREVYEQWQIRPEPQAFPRASNWWDRWMNGTDMYIPQRLRVNNKTAGPKRK